MQSGAMTVREVAPRREFTFVLDGELVERAMHEVGETDMVRSIEAALAAAIDYQLWVREVVTGRRGRPQRSTCSEWPAARAGSAVFRHE